MKRSLFNSHSFVQFSDFAPVCYEENWISLGTILPLRMLCAKIVRRALSLVLVSLLLTSQACFNLEEDTSSVLLLEDLSDEGSITAVLTSIYRKHQQLVAYPGAHFLVAFAADDITTWWKGSSSFRRYLYDRFNYGEGQNADTPHANDAWEAYFDIIYYSNSLIDGLKSSAAPEKTIKIADAEAHFFRALSYLELVKRYGNIPLILDGITPTGREKRATVLENYLQIEQDLMIAEVNLPNPDEVANVGRVSTAAAKALFAEFYMHWAGWPLKEHSKYALAAQKAKDIISLGFFELLPIEKLWLLENQNSRESIFSVQFSKTEDRRSGYPAAYSHHQSRGWSDIYPERQFFYDFPDGARKDATFYYNIPQRFWNGTRLAAKDPAFIPWEESANLHPMYKKFCVSEDLTVRSRTVGYRAIEIYRYAEVLLTYAEASARANGGIVSGDALEALNQVKRRAAGRPYDAPDATVDVMAATAEDVLAEKGWEIAGELGKRWWDLVRTETVGPVMARRDPSEENYLVIDPSEITWKHYIGPIPEVALMLSDLTQNPEGFRIK